MNTYKPKYVVLYKLLIVSVFILAMQFCDSFNTELFRTLQSLYTTDFLIIGKGMSEQDALGYLSMLNFPFLIVTCFAPLGHILVDILGRNRMYFITIGCMILGCCICFFAPNLVIFLIGNAILTLSYSMDIQYIFIAQEIPKNRRAAIRGLSSGISALASILLPVIRGLFIYRLHLSWRYLFLTAIIFCLLLSVVSLIVLYQLPSSSFTCASAADITVTNTTQKPLSVLPVTLHPSTHHLKSFIKSLKSIPQFRSIAFPLMIAGVATAGISFYNEPLLAFSNRSELVVDAVLLIQPLVLLVSSILYGILTTRVSRQYILIACSVLACISLILFCITAKYSSAVILPGILWGLMHTSYYSLIDLLQLMIIELAPTKSVGHFSALAVIVYGFGDAFGLLAASFLVAPLGMIGAKLVTALPFLVICTFLLIRYAKRGVAIC